MAGRRWTIAFSWVLRTFLLTGTNPHLLISPDTMVDASTHIRRGHPIAFGLLILFSLISAIIASVLAADYNDNNSDALTSQGLKNKIRFSVFTGWWTVLFSAIYLGTFLAGVGGVLTSIASHLVFLALTWIFWVAAAGSLTAQLQGGQNCGTSPILHCNSVEALMAFDWINFIITTLLFFTVLIIAFTSFRGGRGLKGEMA